MIQIAFTSAAVNVPERQQEVYVDRQPIEFTELQPSIEALVAKGMITDHFDPQFKELQDFAVLQRLFRAALNGNLGDRFPTLKLAQLTRDTANQTPHVHTRRWNGSSTPVFKLLATRALTAQPGLYPWLRPAQSKLQPCLKSIDDAYQGKGNAAVATSCDFSSFAEEASAACRLSPEPAAACSWAEVFQLAHEVAMEASFGVLEDERESTHSADCPPLSTPNQILAQR